MTLSVVKSDLGTIHFTDFVPQQFHLFVFSEKVSGKMLPIE